MLMHVCGTTPILQAAAELQGTIASGGGSGDATSAPKHVFAALQYLRKLCSHPLLALEAEQRPAEASKTLAKFAAEVRNHQTLDVWLPHWQQASTERGGGRGALQLTPPRGPL